MSAKCQPLLILLFLVAARPVAGEEKPPAVLAEFQQVITKLEYGYFDAARDYLRQHPDVIRNGVKAGGRPFNSFVFRPNHPAYRLSEEHILTAFEILLNYGAPPDEPGVLYTLLKTKQRKAAAMLLEKNPRPDAGGSYLAAAIWGGADVSTIARLIRLPADVNLYDAELKSVPLHLAARFRNHAAAELLLKHGANVDGADEAGRTALHEALRQRAEPALISLLLRHGADPNLADKQGVLPVALAVHHPQPGAVVKQLATAGAKLTPAAMIVLGRNDDLARSVMDENSANRPEPVRSITLLLLAALHGNAAAAEHLLKTGARTDVMFLPLHMAVAQGHVEVVRLLLDHGADANARGENEITPLHVAARVGRADMIDLLLARGAAVKAVSHGGAFVQRNWQPLHFAVAGGHLEAARRLLRAGALRPRNEVLLSELMQMADAAGDRKMVRLLESAM